MQGAIDVDYIATDLSAAAIPQLERLMNNADKETLKQHAKLAIANIAERYELFTGDEKDICRWTLDRQIAVDILDKNGITYAMSEEYFDKYVSSYSFYRDL